ncbi:MAG: ribokinase [Anaerolineae bacterium]|nr:ribokinase [Anaerolineae bacterium]
MVYKPIPTYLIIGHVARDNTPTGAILGGTCSYSALTAHKLGCHTAAVTSYGPDLPSLAALEGITLSTIPAGQSTTFENTYQHGVRQQKWLASSASLSLQDVPPAWRNAPLVHLAPLAQELSPTLCGRFPNSLVCVTMQGWLRGQDAAYQVIYQPHPHLETWLSKIDVLVLSLADVFGDRAALAHFLNSAQVGVETVGPEGCRVYYQGQETHVPVEPEVEVDPTGAGDIFAAAFFIRYYETRNFIQAAQFANACASLSVKKRGMESIPSLPEVETRLAELYGSQPR